MKEKIEMAGYWWFKQYPEQKMSGVLKYTPCKDVLLELISEKEPCMCAYDYVKKNIAAPVIYGDTTCGKATTLFVHSIETTTTSNCSFYTLKIHCSHILIGKYVEDFDTACFFKASVIIPLLSLWCHGKSIEFEQPAPGQIEVTVNTSSIDLNNGTIDDNAHIELKSTSLYHMNFAAGFTANHETLLDLVYEKDVNIQTIINDMNQFLQFLSFVTLQSGKVEKILLYDRTQEIGLINGKMCYDAVELVYNQLDCQEHIIPKKCGFLVPYKYIIESFPYIIHNWYSQREKLSPIRKHLIESIRCKKVFDSIDFLIVIQAIEGFYNRFRKNILDERKAKNKYAQIPLKDIVDLAIAEFSDIEKTKGDNIKVKQVVDSRHYYSHFMEKSEKPNALEGCELRELTHKLRKILMCCMLSHIGFCNDDINMIFNNNNSAMLK